MLIADFLQQLQHGFHPSVVGRVLSLCESNGLRLAVDLSMLDSDMRAELAGTANVEVENLINCACEAAGRLRAGWEKGTLRELC
eukprot:1793117-Karenia_brevis.AAC.1